MPYLNVRISTPKSVKTADKITTILLEHTTRILGKKPDVTSISVDFVDPDYWSIGGGRSVSSSNFATFYLNIKITEGTNTKEQKAEYIQAVFHDMTQLLGKLNPASYISLTTQRATHGGDLTESLRSTDNLKRKQFKLL